MSYFLIRNSKIDKIRYCEMTKKRGQMSQMSPFFSLLEQIWEQHGNKLYSFFMINRLYYAIYV